MKRRLVAVHRWLSLLVLAFWILQALTGIFAVFHWEIDDATIAGAHRPTDFAAIERRVAPLQPGSIWTSAGAPDRYDVNLSDRVLRIDGEGNVLRERLDAERWADGGWVSTLVVLHQSLLSGDRGRAIVGTSGILLLTNIILGLTVAWPRRGQWRAALLPRKTASRVATLFSWHRAVGLWFAVPAFILISAGVLLAFEHWTEERLGVRGLEAPPQSGARRVGMADAVGRALNRYPGAVVSGIGFPSEETGIWKLTIRQSEENRRAYGKTRVWVSAVDGAIVAEHDALRATLARSLYDHLFALHTGEILGLGGRIVVVASGVWLLTTIVLGAGLFLARKTSRR
jgi:uncharacterized iron-regulated membrane protein